MALAVETLLTTAGLALAIDAANLGLTLRLTHVVLGDGETAPTEASTALDNPRLGPIAILSGTALEPARLAVTAVAEPTEAFTVREIGWLAEDGTLVAIAWRGDGILALSPGVTAPMALTLSLVGLPADSVTVEAGPPDLDLAFVAPIAVLVEAMAMRVAAEIDQEIRLRVLEGKWTANMETAL